MDRATTLPPFAAVRRRLLVLSTPLFDRKLTERSLDLCQELAVRCPGYELSFRPAASAVDVLRRTVDAVAESR